MAIKLVDKSDVVEGTQEKNRVDDVYVFGTKKEFQLISADKIFRCKRLELGLTSNCTICQHTLNDVFVECKHKFEG